MTATQGSRTADRTTNNFFMPGDPAVSTLPNTTLC